MKYRYIVAGIFQSNIYHQYNGIGNKRTTSLGPESYQSSPFEFVTNKSVY